MTTSPLITVSSLPDSSALQVKAKKLAAHLNVSFAQNIEQSISDIVLVYTDQGLKLQDISKNVKKPQTLLFVDFTGGKNAYRYAREKTIKQPLARAAGLKSGFRPSIFDATAGLGADGFVLAALGCHVTLCERSAVIGALLLDGIKRASASELTRDIIMERVRFLAEDSLNYLKNTDKSYQCVYLDPMYPSNTRAALNKLPMRVLRAIVGDDMDSETLLNLSLTVALNRVVVKRPLHAECIGRKKPSHQITMKNSRFDVYMTFNG